MPNTGEPACCCYDSSLNCTTLKIQPPHICLFHSFLIKSSISFSNDLLRCLIIRLPVGFKQKLIKEDLIRFLLVSFSHMLLSMGPIKAEPHSFSKRTFHWLSILTESKSLKNAGLLKYLQREHHSPAGHT